MGLLRSFCLELVVLQVLYLSIMGSIIDYQDLGWLLCDVITSWDSYVTYDVCLFDVLPQYCFGWSCAKSSGTGWSILGI